MVCWLGVSGEDLMLVGYARVSTAEQTLGLQRDALTSAGCERVFTDTASGARVERPGLDETLEFLRPGDTLVVWRLDRLGRSLRDLIDTLGGLDQRGIGFRSLQEQIDTTTSGGKLVFHVFGALAEFERDLIRERTAAGLAAARARGRRGGRPKVLDARKAAIAQALYNDKSNAIADICRTLRVSGPPCTDPSAPARTGLAGTCLPRSRRRRTRPRPCRQATTRRTEITGVARDPPEVMWRRDGGDSKLVSGWVAYHLVTRATGAGSAPAR